MEFSPLQEPKISLLTCLIMKMAIFWVYQTSNRLQAQKSRRQLQAHHHENLKSYTSNNVYLHHRCSLCNIQI